MGGGQAPGLVPPGWPVPLLAGLSPAVHVAVRDLLCVGARPGAAASPRLLVAPGCSDRVSLTL